MKRESRPASDDFEDDVEQAMEDKRENVLAADATGLVRSEISPMPEPEEPLAKTPRV